MRIDRYKNAPCFHYSINGDGCLDAPRHEHAHTIARLDSLFDQKMGELIALQIQLAIGQFGVGAAKGDRLGVFAGGLGYRLMQ